MNRRLSSSFGALDARLERLETPRPPGSSRRKGGAPHPLHHPPPPIVPETDVEPEIQDSCRGLRPLPGPLPDGEAAARRGRSSEPRTEPLPVTPSSAFRWARCSAAPRPAGRAAPEPECRWGRCWLRGPRLSRTAPGRACHWVRSGAGPSPAGRTGAVTGVPFGPITVGGAPVLMTGVPLGPMAGVPEPATPGASVGVPFGPDHRRGAAGVDGKAIGSDGILRRLRPRQVRRRRHPRQAVGADERVVRVDGHVRSSYEVRIDHRRHSARP